MSGIDVSKVMVGAPDQKTTGAIFDAPVGTAAPASARDELAEGFVSSGYVSEDGVSISQDRSTTDIKDWSRAVVRKALESFDGTLSWSEIQMSYEALCHAFGAANVVKTAATSEHGEQVTVSIGGELPEVRAWCFNMKDGKARIRIYVPKGQVTGIDTITFSASDAIALPITLATYPDDDGVNIYIMTDDGVLAAA